MTSTPAPSSSSPPRSRWRDFGFRFLLLAGSLFVTLAALELLLVAVDFSTSPVDIQSGRQSDARAFHVFEDRNFEYHPDLIWSPKRSTSVFNSQGFRGPELAPVKSPGSIRLFTVGDSNTLGWAGPAGANWPEELGRQLRARGDDVVVVNAGVWGYASYQGVRRFRQTLAFDPDIVLVSFGSNDAHRVFRSDRQYDARSFRQTEMGRALQRLKLGDLLLSTLERTFGGGGQLEARVSPDDYRANLTTIIDEARARNVQIVLLTRPYVGPIPDAYQWKNWGADYNAATAEVAAARGVRLVDVYSFFKMRDELFADESHFTDEGHRLAAAVILDHILPLVERRR